MKPRFADRLVYALALLLVLLGLVNVTPAIPGWDDLWKNLTGNEFFKVRRFSTEWLFPITFFWMMLIVALKHSMWRDWKEHSPIKRKLGLALDIALVAMAFVISATYLTEIEAVCLVDRVTGERALLIAESLKAEVEMAELLGLPAPTTVDDPQCVNNTGGWLVLIVG